MTILVRDVVWLLLAFVTVCVATELASRWWIRSRSEYFVQPPGLRLHLQPDAEAFPELERDVHFDVNSHGERGDEIPSGTDAYRVLVAGGSQPEGFMLDQHTAWPGALQRQLAQPSAAYTLGAAHVHVGSIARSGVGSEALDLIFARILPRYPRLQLIVIMVGATDVLRWLEQGAPATIAPVQPADVFRCSPEARFGWTPSTLASAELIGRARHRWLRPIDHRTRTGRWIADARAKRARATRVVTTMPDPAPMLDHFTHHFSRLVARARAHADRLLVVRQPWFDKEFSAEEAAHMWHGGAGQVWREDVATYYSFDVCSRLMWILDTHAANLSAKLGLEQLDLMPVIDRSLENYYDGFHLTPKGAHAVADAIATAVLAGQPAREPSVHRSRAKVQIPARSYAGT